MGSAFVNDFETAKSNYEPPDGLSQSIPAVLSLSLLTLTGEEGGKNTGEGLEVKVGVLRVGEVRKTLRVGVLRVREVRLALQVASSDCFKDAGGSTILVRDGM